MINYQKRITSLLVFLSLLCSLYAQEPLTLEACRSMALENNKQLSAARLSQDMASYNRQSARTKYLPRVDAVAGYELMSKEVSILNNEQKAALNNLGTNATNKVGGDISAILTQMVQDGSISPQMAQQLGQQLGGISSSLAAMGDELGSTIRKAFRTNNRSMFAGSVLVSQPIYMGGSITAMNRMADINEMIASDNYDLIRQNTLYEIDAAYWLVVSLKHKQQLAESYLKLVKQLNEDVDKMIAEGVSTRADGLNMNVRVNDAEMSKMKVDDGLTLARMLLCQLCGMKMDTPITLADEVREIIPSDPSITDNTVVTRPELNILSNTIELGNQSSKLIKAAYLRPQVALTGGYLISNPNLYNGFERKFSGVWNIGLMVRMPLWNWNEGNLKLRAARAATTIAEMERKDLGEKIDLQIEQQRFKLREAFRRLELSEKHVESAEENLRCANLGFREGVINLSELTAAQTAWEAAHNQKIDAEIEVKLSQVGLKKALGQLE